MSEKQEHSYNVKNKYCPSHISHYVFMSIRKFVLLNCVLFILLLCFSNVSTVFGQQESPKLVRDRGLEMLQNIESLLREKYYDLDFHGVNLKEEFDRARKEIKNIETNTQVYTIIAQVIDSLKDSHTKFIPPGFAESVDYGIKMQMIGDTCYVITVKKGSDAENKGIKPGDIVRSFQAFTLTRDSFSDLIYFFTC